MENLTQLFIDAGKLMLAGMVFVFAFLGLLIIFINQVLVKLAIKFPDPVNQNSRKKAKVKTSEQDGVSPQIVAAISSAVSQYRQKHNNKE
ncbi:OadG family transporter subunit [Thalassotalea marina]|uniref:Probable oxaloacetate decarboxylase gamma chain n=1 Tax=Thalassotalea marina TaxID=1673741 RepID=A0A919BDX0_9GAMM|nr:OadG family transporter subunit [Thalassotalea marina]GHF85659.1 putative oxaloacetate decarboxylase gamma chain [Thalassotalea marina]